MPTVTLTQAQFDAIPVLAKQPAAIGLKIKKFDGEKWFQIEYISQGTGGNWVQVISDIIFPESNQANSEKIGRRVAIDLHKELQRLNLTPVQAEDLLGRTTAVLTYLGFGWVREARVRCNLLAAGGELTAGRKAFLLARIDEAILLI